MEDFLIFCNILIYLSIGKSISSVCVKIFKEYFSIYLEKLFLWSLVSSKVVNIASKTEECSAMKAMNLNFRK